MLQTKKSLHKNMQSETIDRPSPQKSVTLK